mgnify:CR=1 FL=1
MPNDSTLWAQITHIIIFILCIYFGYFIRLTWTSIKIHFECICVPIFESTQSIQVQLMFRVWFRPETTSKVIEVNQIFKFYVKVFQKLTNQNSVRLLWLSKLNSSKIKNISFYDLQAWWFVNVVLKSIITRDFIN